MSFIVQRISGPRGILQEYKQAVLTIGRGTTAQLRSENPSVALEHAVIEASEGGFDLVDRGSITGTYLNDERVVDTAPIADRDRLQVGDHLIELIWPERNVLTPVLPAGAATCNHRSRSAAPLAPSQSQPA